MLFAEGAGWLSLMIYIKSEVVAGLYYFYCLIFYGLTLVNASKYTFDDIKYLGFIEIGLGLVATLYLGYGLFFWAIGFGVLHIIYGIFMYLKYDR